MLEFFLEEQLKSFENTLNINKQGIVFCNPIQNIMLTGSVDR